MLEIVDNQVRDNTPPQTRQTLARLQAEGHSPEEARRLIGYIVAVELNDMLRELRPFDVAAFVVALERLPALPLDEPPSDS
jgi:hypothetical protein